jgi:hypothetical protein
MYFTVTNVKPNNTYLTNLFNYMNTQDLSKLGYREIGQLADILKLYSENPNDCGLSYGVKWEYNPDSDNLFLVDDDFNVAMVNDDTGKLERWHTCGNCGLEGFRTNIKFHEKDSDLICQCGDLI